MKRRPACVLIALGTTLLPVLALATPASAGKPLDRPFHFADEQPVHFTIHECGLEIDVAGMGRGMDFVSLVPESDGQAFLFHSNATFRETWTTDAGELTLVIRSAFREIEATQVPGQVSYTITYFDEELGREVTEERVSGDGDVWTFTSRDAGVFTWYDEDGRAVLRFAGPYVTSQQFDTLGDSQPGGFPVPDTLEVLRLKNSWRGLDHCAVFQEHLG